MNDLERIRQWFDRGALCRPVRDQPDFIDMVRAMHSLSGAPGVKSRPQTEVLKKVIGTAEHYVLVLIDGLGEHLLECLPRSSFLRSHHESTLRALFPSTTATALTSLATGEYPAVHGVTGWWVWLAEHGLTATVLPFRERFGEKDLRSFGIGPEEVFQVPPVVPVLGHAPFTLVMEKIADSVYTRYSTGNTPIHGYKEPAAALEEVIRRIAAAQGPTYTYLYLTEVDSLAHEKGVACENMPDILHLADTLMETLASFLKDKARIVITADHGLTDVTGESWLNEDHSLMDLLVCPPAGEASVPYFYPKQGLEAEFARAFRDIFGDRFALISRREAEEAGLFGPEPLAESVRPRLGDFIGIAAEPEAIWYEHPEEKDKDRLRGIHGGLRPQEMLLPLILA